MPILVTANSLPARCSRKLTGRAASRKRLQMTGANSRATVKRICAWTHERAIVDKGYGDLMVYRSKCCNPIPGDDIIGYVTRGRGIAVHGKNCPNVKKICLYEAERRIPVEWAGTPHTTFPVRLRIFTGDRPGICRDHECDPATQGANIRTFESGGHALRARIDVA